MTVKNAHLPAMPITDSQMLSDTGAIAEECFGLSKREYTAIKIMAGFAACDDTTGSIGEIAEYAVKWADALLAELDK